MNAKKLLVSFVMIASILLLAANVSAFDSIKVDNVDAEAEDVSIVAGETIVVEVVFTATENVSDVRLDFELKGSKKDVEKSLMIGDVEDGKTYRRAVTMQVPYDFKDEVSDDVTLDLEFNKDIGVADDSVTLRVQRPSYDAKFMSIGVSQKVEAGKLFPVDIVVKNVGYNDLDDLYVTASIAELGVEKSAYFGDLVAIEDKDDDDDTDVNTGRLFLEVPFNVKEGTYTLTVEARNDDVSVSSVKKIVVEKSLGSNIVVSGNQLIVLNPTTSLLGLRLVPEASNELSVSLSESVVAVPAGSTKTVTITPTANTATAGTYSYKVNVFSLSGELLETVTLNANVEGSTASNAFVVFTVILTIIFLVLLVALVVLITRKPEKAEELGESYY